jgi:hypothetical protein
MRAWSIKGWFYDANAERPSAHELTVGAYNIDSAIDLAVEMWNKSRVGIKQVERKEVYGVSNILVMDVVEEG